MTPPHEHAGTTAATGTAAPRCQCDQQLGAALPVLLVAAAVILIIERLRSWARRRRELRDQAAR